MKATIFLLPFLLLVTTRFSTLVEAVLPQCQAVQLDTEAMAPPPEEPHGSHPLIKAPPAPSPEKPHHHAPAHSPEKPHYCHHGPGKAPCHKREKHHAPGKAPSHSPEEHHHAHVPMHPPIREGTPFPNRKPDCSTRCGKYCKKDDHKKEEEKQCVDVCTVCCKKYECVPREHNKKCKWSDFEMEGKPVKCHH